MTKQQIIKAFEQAEKYGAHYSDGKLKFYRIK